MNSELAHAARLAGRAGGWTLAVSAFIVGVVVLLACYWQTAESLIWVWDHDGTYQYAFLIFPISLWLAFTLRHRVRANPPVPSLWGLVAMLALVFIWYAGHMLDINVVQHFAFVALFPALVLACWGWRALWVLVFPLAYLVVFAVPWGDGLVGPLQDFTARFAVHALALTGTPVLLNGREIVTASATWMVEDACSGVKFFIACTALGCLFAWLMYQRRWKRVLFVALAAVVPIIANGLRVYFTVLIGEGFGLKYATGTDHMIFGWQFFGTVLLLLFLVGWFFRDPLTASKPPPATGRKPGDARMAIWIAALVVLIAGPVTAAILVSPAQPESMRLTAPTLAGWRGPQTATDGWRPSFKGAAGQVHVAYRSLANAAVIDLYHAVYTGKPRRGHSLITYGNDLYDSAQSRVLSHTGVSVDLAGGAGTTAAELRLTGTRGSRLVWYWYCVDHRCTRSPVIAKLLQAWDVLRGQATRSSVWALSSPVAGSDADQVRTRLRTFARTLPVVVESTSQTTRPDIARSRP